MLDIFTLPRLLGIALLIVGTKGHFDKGRASAPGRVQGASGVRLYAGDPLCRENNQGFPAWTTVGTPRALPVGGEGAREGFGAPVQSYQSPGMGSMPSWGHRSTPSAALGGARAGHAAGG